MNKILLILTTVFITGGVLAQVPEKMSYQAVVRNGKNALVANQPIGLRISIIQGAVNGAAVYQEVFKPNPVTNANGLVTAEIGSGTPTLGAFSSINWANGPYFIKAETDTTGGTNYTITGTTRLLSVPYALHAKTAESFSGTITETDPAYKAWDKDYNDIINKPDLSVYATKDMINQNIANRDYNNLLNKPDLSDYTTKDMVNQNIGSSDYNELLNKPDLSVYATKDMANQTYLNYNEFINKPDLSVYATKEMVYQTNPNYNEIINKPDLSIYATKDMANQNITNLANPINPEDAATKAYIDVLLKRLERLEKLVTNRLLTGSFIDMRDGTHYELVKIGKQVWMAENLKYLPEVTELNTLPITEPYYYVYGYNGTNITVAKTTDNYNTYGVLYNWPAAMNGATESNSNPSGVQGVCPTGWHLPSSVEWKQLIDYLGGGYFAAKKLMETGTSHWQDSISSATNRSGFTALPGGALINNYYSNWEWYEEGYEDWAMNWIFSGVGLYSQFWSTSWKGEGPENIAIRSSGLTISSYQSEGGMDYYQGQGFSVRCVKD